MIDYVLNLLGCLAYDKERWFLFVNRDENCWMYFTPELNTSLCNKGKLGLKQFYEHDITTIFIVKTKTELYHKHDTFLAEIRPITKEELKTLGYEKTEEIRSEIARSGRKQSIFETLRQYFNRKFRNWRYYYLRA